MSNAIRPYLYLNAQVIEKPQFIESNQPSRFLYIPESEFVFNPFPNNILNLIQPLDSLSRAKGGLRIKYDDVKTKITLAKDWSTITITEYIDGSSYKMPFTADVEWYLKKYNERKSYSKFIELMQLEAKDGSSTRKGKKMEGVGVDIGK